jgi:alkanesulfonate monooxygenase SsuD/methylene tetrahydromethanopterin reductase-like flavin-dependent oxidoreductase (luciferase family)
MRLGLNVGHWGAQPIDPTELARAAESIGYDSVWTRGTVPVAGGEHEAGAHPTGGGRLRPSR